MKLRVFVDYWNFQLNWNNRANGGKCDWTKLSSTLVQRAQTTLNSLTSPPTLQLEESRVYASYEPGREEKLRTWLGNFLDRQPGVRVFQCERHWRKKGVHCRNCNTETSQCPQCSADLGRAAEKTIDALIVTDLLALAWEGAFEVALLLSGDRDFIPAVDKLQTKNFKVINATWRGHGHELAKVCWASFEIDPLIPLLVRP